MVPGSISCRVLGNFQVSCSLMSAFSSPGVHSASNRSEDQGVSLVVKYGRRVELTILPEAKHCIPHLSLHTCNGKALPLTLNILNSKKESHL